MTTDLPVKPSVVASCFITGSVDGRNYMYASCSTTWIVESQESPESQPDECFIVWLFRKQRITAHTLAICCNGNPCNELSIPLRSRDVGSARYGVPHLNVSLFVLSLLGHLLRRT
jgi:hypothetical protein